MESFGESVLGSVVFVQTGMLEMAGGDGEHGVHEERVLFGEGEAVGGVYGVRG